MQASERGKLGFHGPMLLYPIILPYVRASHWGLTLGFTLLNDIQSFCAEDSHFPSCLHNKSRVTCSLVL